jgi:predicted amidophosphoribosyltransferase
MDQKEPEYCPQCNAPWVSRMEFCVQCGEPLMDQGDFHSGPHGYSANTAYPDTQYGSGFDEEAEWNQ